MTVKELIDVLKKYPMDMKVLFTWESTYVPVLKSYIYKSKQGHLYLDADYGSYKSIYAEDPNENVD